MSKEIVRKIGKSGYLKLIGEIKGDGDFNIKFMSELIDLMEKYEVSKLDVSLAPSLKLKKLIKEMFEKT